MDSEERTDFKTQEETLLQEYYRLKTLQQKGEISHGDNKEDRIRKLYTILFVDSSAWT